MLNHHGFLDSLGLARACKGEGSLSDASLISLDLQP